jgi:hypothetical protein
MLRHLVDFCTRSIRLDLKKPLIQENDFVNVQETKDGLVIENARFKTRVRANRDEPVRHCNIVSGIVVDTLINRPGWFSN